MGTRSLLAVETKRGTYHVQYMQFDGYPSIKGYEYYKGVLDAVLQVGITNVTTKKGNPNALFRKRCVDFLNNYQYASYHSTGNNFEAMASDWTKGKIDMWQQWQYVFKYNGDFQFFSTCKEEYGGFSPITIPWGLTKLIGQAFISGYDFDKDPEQEEGILQLYFNELDNYSTRTQIKLVLEHGEIMAFKGKHGWRHYATLKVVKGRKILSRVNSLFYSKRGEKRNKDSISVLI